MKRKAVAAGLITVGIFLVGGHQWWQRTAATAASAPAAAAIVPLTLPIVDSEGLSGFDEREQAIIRQLRTKYGSSLAGVALQVQVIGNLMDLLQKLYPRDWEARLLRILAAAFPKQAQELLSRYQSLTRYNDWVKDILPLQAFDTPELRRQAIWDKRVEIFGEAAYEIWALELRERKLAETLQQLGQSTAPFAQKAETYREQLRATYGDNVFGPEAPHLTQNLTRFLELPSVQQDLRAKPPAERRELLRDFRRSMGLDEPALERWDALDAERDQVRSSGELYMAERARLTARLQGAALDAELRALQERLFGNEARFIRNEEEAGYFRFNTPQKLGVN